MIDYNEYRAVKILARELKITEENLVRAFTIEKDFHARVLRENDSSKRKQLYREVYETVHPIYGTKPAAPGVANPKDRIVRMFKKELSGKSILEVGCGNGLFLASVARLLPHKELVGIDISAPVLPGEQDGIRFIRADIIDFALEENFDVVYSEHVIEHIAPADLAAHLTSLTRHLKENGTLIICAPNRNFGPNDVTRILDCSHTGKITAMGTHLHEPTHGELMELLKKYGFTVFQTIFPFMKVRNYLGSLRLPAKMLTAIENNSVVMKFLHAIRFRNRCIARFDTILICTKA
jgi:2-polyprenyl-3-methyl-5-hydroxy-6-metoxy-1,4-benzoquinol methylase